MTEKEKAAFALLGIVNPPLTEKEINEAYHRLALVTHPDKNGSTLDATKAMQDLNSAYETIKKYPEKTKGGSKRRKYRKTRRRTKRHRKTHS